MALEHGLGVIMGIGVNVNFSAEDLQMIDQPATSLLAESGSLEDIFSFMHLLIAHFEKQLHCTV